MKRIAGVSLKSMFGCICLVVISHIQHLGTQFQKKSEEEMKQNLGSLLKDSHDLAEQNDTRTTSELISEMMETNFPEVRNKGYLLQELY